MRSEIPLSDGFTADVCRGRLLLVDDSPLVLRMTADFLVSERWDVVTARSGRDALALAASSEPDVIVCDLNMPDLSGIDVVRGVQEIDPLIPVIMLSGERNLTPVIEAVHAGVFDFVPKSTDLRPLAAAIRRAHDHVLVVRENERLSADLRRTNEQLRAIVETTRAVPWEMEPETWRFTYAGPQVVKLLGEPVERWLTQGFLEERLMPEDRELAIAALRAALQEVGDREIEVRLRAADGRWVWARTLLSARATPSGRMLCGILLDVTETKRLESELRQAQKLESVGRLAAGIAHEINTPVQFVNDSVHFARDCFEQLVALLGEYRALYPGVVQGSPQTDVERMLAQAEHTADLEDILANGPDAVTRAIDGLQRIASIVRSMREFAHPEQKSRTSIDLNHALQTTLTIARGEYKYVADVETDFGDVPLVAGLASEINQAFLNIIVNAAHSIADVMQTTGERGRISVRTRQEGPCVLVSIADTGGGISPGIRDRVFDPFFTTKQVGRGTGQGLAITRSVVVDKHGGSITFDTALGRGTTFHIRLPIEGARGAG
jgi:PAS domain S-box-containing protein